MNQCHKDTDEEWYHFGMDQMLCNRLGNKILVGSVHSENSSHLDYKHTQQGMELDQYAQSQDI